MLHIIHPHATETKINMLIKGYVYAQQRLAKNIIVCGIPVWKHNNNNNNTIGVT